VPKIVCDEAKRLIAEKTGLPRSHVLISSSHTHSGGSARERSDTTAEEIRDGFTGDRPVMDLCPNPSTRKPFAEGVSSPWEEELIEMARTLGMVRYRANHVAKGVIVLGGDCSPSLDVLRVASKLGPGECGREFAQVPVRADSDVLAPIPSRVAQASDIGRYARIIGEHRATLAGCNMLTGVERQDRCTGGMMERAMACIHDPGPALGGGLPAEGDEHGRRVGLTKR